MGNSNVIDYSVISLHLLTYQPFNLLTLFSDMPGDNFVANDFIKQPLA